MDPLLFIRLGQIRQQEILEQATWDRKPRVVLIHGSRLLDGLRSLAQRVASHRSLPGQAALDQTACE